MSSNSSETAACRQPNPPGTSNAPLLKLWQRSSAPLTCLFVFLTVVTFPPAIPYGQDGQGLEADTSLSLILDHAVEHGIQFGTEHVYTYGPLGRFIFFVFSPKYAGYHFAADVLVGIIVTAGLYLLGKLLTPGWRLVLLGSFVWVCSNTYPRTDLLIDSAILCFGLLCFQEQGQRLVSCAAVLALFTAFMALSKNSYLLVGTLTVSLVALDLLLRRQHRLAFAFLGLFILVSLGGWLLLAQDVRSLGESLLNILAMVHGYNAALGWQEPATAGWLFRLLGMLLAGLVLAAAMGAFLRRDQTRPIRRALLFTWLAALSFAAWKHGMVRAYACNLQMLAGFIALVGAALQIVPESRLSRKATRALGFACCLVALLSVQWLFFEPPARSITAPFRVAWHNLATLAYPPGYLDQMKKICEDNLHKAQLPEISKVVGSAAIDVFGRRQAFALLNHLNYRPRPLPQSYAVGNKHLMRLNQGFYLSQDAPEFVLFELNPLDRKFPALEDAWLLRHLLLNYQYVTSEAGFALLRRTSADPVRLSPLREEVVQPGQRIDLSDFASAPVWMEIVMEPSFVGKLKQFLFRPPIVRLTAWDAAGKPAMRGRAPASMLAAGFLAHPLLKRTQDVIELYANLQLPSAHAYSVDLESREAVYWNENLRVSIFRIENTMPGFTASADPQTPAASPQSTPTPRPFTLFRTKRWRPDQPPPGNLQEQIALALLMLAPCLLIGLLFMFGKRVRRSASPVGWRGLILGNTLVLGLLLSVAGLAGEVYFRFFYDTTDSLGYTRASERWVMRHWQVNTAGCRDNIEYQPRLTPGRHRVTFVGDSFTAGHGVRNVEDRFANRLRATRTGWEIHVLANVGLDTGSQIVLLNRAVSKGYQFEDVVLVYCLNDIGDLLPMGGLDASQLAAGWANNAWLLQNSYLCNFLYHRLRAAQNTRIQNYFPLVRAGYEGEPWEKQKERLKTIRDIVNARGGRLSAVTFPFLHALGPDYEYRFVHEQLAQLWSELGVAHLDLLPIYQGFAPRELTVNQFDAHPNELANELAAKAIHRFLVPPVENHQP